MARRYKGQVTGTRLVTLKIYDELLRKIDRGGYSRTDYINVALEYYIQGLQHDVYDDLTVRQLHEVNRKPWGLPTSSMYRQTQLSCRVRRDLWDYLEINAYNKNATANEAVHAWQQQLLIDSSRNNIIKPRNERMAHYRY